MSTQNRLDRTDLYIGGKFVEAESTARVEAINPATEQVVGSVPDASETDVDRAAAAARQALDGWRRTSGAERAAVLTAVADALAERAPEIASLVTRENGAPKWWVERDVNVAVLSYRQAARDAAELQPEQLVEDQLGRTLLRREPIGVVGAIAPWNSPNALMAFKVAPALAAGCTVLAKPSPETSLDTYLLAEVYERAGLPAGVVNIVTGGPGTGAAVAAHPGVDKVSFTGSTASGKAVAAACAQSLKPVTAELGGKSAAVLLDDADIDEFVDSIHRECLPYSGQACYSTTRVIVPRSLHDEVVERAVAALADTPFGDPADPATVMGPLVSARQRDRVEAHLRSGVEQGARVVLGGGRAPGFDTGFYIAPTVFTGVTPDMRIFAEEIFGPALVVSSYDTEDEAVVLHDATEYGLSGSVFSRDKDRATAFARRLSTGQVLVNGRRGTPNVVRDMYKSSALGGGVDRVEGFLLTKAISQP
ncbi:aldehyde dehydrogenase family protein [Streptomyces sp. NPDC056296]|uniref:aldehyde dehydrogenase family protein n=1 Tax=Streptomyces sp. NPDC056296 TaxID=3345775 RepID=UPI0035DB2C56